MNYLILIILLLIGFLTLGLCVASYNLQRKNKVLFQIVSMLRESCSLINDRLVTHTNIISKLLQRIELQEEQVKNMNEVLKIENSLEQ